MLRFGVGERKDEEVDLPAEEFRKLDKGRRNQCPRKISTKRAWFGGFVVGCLLYVSMVKGSAAVRPPEKIAGGGVSSAQKISRGEPLPPAMPPSLAPKITRGVPLPPAMPPRHRVAIVISGTPEGYKQTYQSLTRSLTLPNKDRFDFDIFLVVGFLDRPRADYGSASATIRNQQNADATLENLRQIYKPKRLVHRPLVGVDKTNSQVIRLLEGFSLVVEEENLTGKAYDLVIRLRFDIFLYNVWQLEKFLGTCTTTNGCVWTQFVYYTHSNSLGETQAVFAEREQKLHRSKLFACTYEMCQFTPDWVYVLDSAATRGFAAYHVPVSTTQPQPPLQQLSSVLANCPPEKYSACVGAPEAISGSIMLAKRMEAPFSTQTLTKAFPVGFLSRPRQELYAYYYDPNSKCVREKIVVARTQDSTVDFDALMKGCEVRPGAISS